MNENKNLHARVTRNAEDTASFDTSSLVGLELGGYRLDEPIGQGGMGSVFRATQLSLGRSVAVKVLAPELSGRDQMVSRFKREIKTLTSLSHPNIVALLDGGFDSDKGLYYYVMELIDGVTVRDVIDGGGLEPAKALLMVPKICDALEYAHQMGVVHRDVKPANILLDREGRVKIADFGLSRLIEEKEDEGRITRTQQVMGTVEYMAPEQREGAKHIDHRADIYSLGVVFYELLTGELPIGRFDPPSKKVEVDVRLDDVVLRVLAKDPQRRYQRASEVAVDVRSLESDSAVASPGTSGSHQEEEDMEHAISTPSRVSGWAIASFVLALLIIVPFVLGMLALLFLGATVQSG